MSTPSIKTFTDHQCQLCRHFRPTSDTLGECRGGFPTALADRPRGVWPVVANTDDCGRFLPITGKRGVEPKVSDRTVFEMLWERVEPKVNPDGSMLLPMARRRSLLIADLKQMGMTETPALRKILRMVREGKIKQGDNPWPTPGDEKGIYVWVDPKCNGKMGETALLDEIRVIAPDASKARSLRGLHRELVKAGMSISLTTLSRRLTTLQEEGTVVQTEAGYYAPPEAGQEEGVEL